MCVKVIIALSNFQQWEGTTKYCECDLHRCQNWRTLLDTALMGTSSPPPDKEKTRAWEQSAVDIKHNCGYNAHIIFVILMTNGRLSSYWLTSWPQSRCSHAAASHATRHRVTQSHIHRQWSRTAQGARSDHFKVPLSFDSKAAEGRSILWSGDSFRIKEEKTFLKV